MVAYGFVELQCVLILKYIVPDYTGYTYYGAANVATNAGIMISCVPFLPSTASLFQTPVS